MSVTLKPAPSTRDVPGQSRANSEALFKRNRIKECGFLLRHIELQSEWQVLSFPVFTRLHGDVEHTQGFRGTTVLLLLYLRFTFNISIKYTLEGQKRAAESWDLWERSEDLRDLESHPELERMHFQEEWMSLKEQLRDSVCSILYGMQQRASGNLRSWKTTCQSGREVNWKWLVQNRFLDYAKIHHNEAGAPRRRG